MSSELDAQGEASVGKSYGNDKIADSFGGFLPTEVNNLVAYLNNDREAE